MSLTLSHLDQTFGIGDRVRVVQKIKEKDKFRSQGYEGVVIKIKGDQGEKTFTVRRIGESQIGIERVFPIDSPAIEKIQVIKKGTQGVARAKLYYLRGKAAKSHEKIYRKVAKRNKQSTK